MSRKRSNTELMVENKLLRRFNFTHSIASIVIAAFKFGTFCFIFYMLYRSVECLSGKITHAQILIDLLGSLKVNNAIAYMLTGSAVVYGMSERKLRQRTIKRLHKVDSNYELLFDKKRSSSNLSIEGRTNPNDIR